MPNIDVYVTTILSSTGIRGRHERVEAVLRSLRVPYSTHDVASDEKAKSHWKRKDTTNELPCILVDDERVGVSAFSQREECGAHADPTDISLSLSRQSVADLDEA